MMQLTLTGRHIEVTPALKTFATEKFQRIERRFDSIKKIHVVFQLENLSQIAEATVHVDGTDIHASAQSDDMYTTIDMLIDKLLNQITKHKEKTSDHHR